MEYRFGHSRCREKMEGMFKTYIQNHYEWKFTTNPIQTDDKNRDKIHKFDNSSSDKCLKCGTQSDSLIHAFWYCEKLKVKSLGEHWEM